MRLSEYRGKLVVLFVAGFKRPFGAPPERTRAQIVGVFRQLAKSVDEKSVGFLGVIETDPEGFKNEAKASGVPIHFWCDPDQDIRPRSGHRMAAGVKEAGAHPGRVGCRDAQLVCHRQTWIYSLHARVRVRCAGEGRHDASEGTGEMK